MDLLGFSLDLPVDPSYKQCPRCKRYKPRSEFAKDRGRPDGLFSRCRDCDSRAIERKTCLRCKVSKAVHPKTFFKDDNVCRDCRLAANEKRCRECRKIKPLHLFRSYKERTHGGMCGQCHDRKYKKAHNQQRIKREFNLSPEAYNAAVKAQGGGCAICGKQPKRTEKVLHIDHNHATGIVRGLLCADCNLGLGRFHDDPTLLQAAIDYLEHHNGMAMGAEKQQLGARRS